MLEFVDMPEEKFSPAFFIRNAPTIISGASTIDDGAPTILSKKLFYFGMGILNFRKKNKF